MQVVNMKVKTVYLEQNDNVAEIVTTIAQNSNNFSEFIDKLENSGVDKKVVNTIKLWTF